MPKRLPSSSLVPGGNGVGLALGSPDGAGAGAVVLGVGAASSASDAPLAAGLAVEDGMTGGVISALYQQVSPKTGM